MRRHRSFLNFNAHLLSAVRGHWSIASNFNVNSFCWTGCVRYVPTASYMRNDLQAMSNEILMTHVILDENALGIVEQFIRQVLVYKTPSGQIAPT